MSLKNNIGIRPAHLARALISKLNGMVVEVRPGFKETELDRVAKIIVDEYQLRRKNADPRSSNIDGLTPSEWLRVTLYGVILVWLDHDEHTLLEDRIPERMAASQSIDASPAALFHRSIAAVLADSGHLITASERKRMAEPMWYAFRHYIPPELLLGFNHQYPGHRVDYALGLDDLEPSLTEWMKEQRLYALWRGGQLEDYRGDYPPDIDDGPRKIVNELY
jgi:hypothetical protein